MRKLCNIVLDLKRSRTFLYSMRKLCNIVLDLKRSRKFLYEETLQYCSRSKKVKNILI